jgi:hypothetical protein
MAVSYSSIRYAELALEYKIKVTVLFSTFTINYIQAGSCRDNFESFPRLEQSKTQLHHEIELTLDHLYKEYKNV